jgi:hypothetical protein
MPGYKFDNPTDGSLVFSNGLPANGNEVEPKGPLQILSGVLASSLVFPGLKFCPQNGLLALDSHSNWNCYGPENANGKRAHLFELKGGP